MSTRNIFWGGKGSRCIWVTTLPPSCADCLEIWEPQPPGTLSLSRPLHGLLYLIIYWITERIFSKWKFLESLWLGIDGNHIWLYWFLHKKKRFNKQATPPLHTPSIFILPLLLYTKLNVYIWRWQGKLPSEPTVMWLCNGGYESVMNEVLNHRYMQK
jgi:hypothetical protein